VASLQERGKQGHFRGFLSAAKLFLLNHFQGSECAKPLLQFFFLPVQSGQVGPGADSTNRSYSCKSSVRGKIYKSSVTHETNPSKIYFKDQVSQRF
jgi:hypothetical protein